MLEISEADLNNETIALLQKSAELIYPSDSLRLKQKESFNKDYLHKILIATKDNEPVARLAIYNNPNLIYNGTQAACIGNFECIHDDATAKTIIDKAVQIVKSELKLNFIIGPMNGSTWDNYRFSLHHNSPNFFLESYHHLYYNDLFKNSGFQPIAQYISSLDRELTHDTLEISKLYEHFTKLEVTLRNIELTNYESELEKVYHLSKDAFKTNFLYSPLSLASFKEKYLAVKQLVNPEFVLMAEDNKKNLIGFIFAIDDLYNSEHRSLIIKTIARKNEKHWSGLGSILGNTVIKRAFDKKYFSVIHAFMIEDATSRGLSNKFTGKVYKNYALYGNQLG